MTGQGLSRRSVAALGLAAPFVGPALVRAEPLDEAREPASAIATDEDRYSHIIAPVYVNGQGPFRFLVDTGANRSAIDEGLAARLGLPLGPNMTVNTVLGARPRPTVRVDELRIAGRLQRRVTLPTLAITGVSADGVLGVDWLKNRRLTFHFGQRHLEIAGPAAVASLGNYSEVLLPARLRAGQLSVIDAWIGGRGVAAMIDTGAQSTLGNRALQAMIADQQGVAPESYAVGINTVTGERVDGELMRVPDLRLGGMRLRQTPVIFADLKLFDLWGMQREPAMVLGLDLIASFDRVTLDYGRRQVRLELDRTRGRMLNRRAAAERRRSDPASVSQMDGPERFG